MSPAPIHPSSVERSLSLWRFALRQALRIMLGVPPSIGLSVFRRAFLPPSASPYSVGHSALRRVFISAIHRPLSVPPPVECSALCRVCLPSGRPALLHYLRSLSGYPSSVWRSALHRGFRLPSDAPPSVEFSISEISRPLSVSPYFERFEDCVLNTPTGYSFGNLRTVSSKRKRGPDSSNMRTVYYISRQDLALSNQRTTSSKNGLISCALSMSHDTDIAVKMRRYHCHRQQIDISKKRLPILYLWKVL